MSTLLFCTSFSDCKSTWNNRYRQWLDYNSNSALHYEQCLIIDDASPCLPDWSDIGVFTTKFETKPQQTNVLVSFNKHLGRPSGLNYPGWYRSYGFAAKYALKFNFKKIIHIESDAYLLSKEIFDYINTIDKGWTSFWSNRYNFPETAIQIICEDQLNNFFWFSNQKYEQTYINKPIELITPFTNINKHFKGDRYLEFASDIPSDSDFVCQAPINFNLIKHV